MTAHFSLTIHGADAANISIGLKQAISPDVFETGCRAIVAMHDGDEAHRVLDQYVTWLLRTLGYGEGMDVFLAHVGPYHPTRLAHRAGGA